MRGIMDAFSDPDYDELCFMKSAQTGGTEVLNNVVGFHIDQDPSPIFVLQPSLEMAKAWSKDRFAPMLRDTRALHGKVKDPRSRDGDNTLLHKGFPGGHITTAGANSPASLASRPIRVVLCDEVDRYPASAGTEGDPVSLIFKRANNFWNRKRATISTPTIKGASRIEAKYDESTQDRYHVPCPKCGQEQRLTWDRVEWEKDDDGNHKPETAAYHCEGCSHPFTEGERLDAIQSGRWIPECPDARIKGFHISELYSPWVTVQQMVEDFLEAKKSRDTLQTWVNTALGEPWEDRGDGLDANILSARREPYGPDNIPEGVLVVVAGVDVQQDRFEVEFIGYGRDRESWGLDYEVLYGDLAKRDAWSELWDLISTRTYEHPYGITLNVIATGIDTGGSWTTESYQFCQQHLKDHIYAMKGQGGAGLPLVVSSRKTRSRTNRSGKARTKAEKYNVKLFMVGVDSGKQTLFGRLAITDPGAEYCHFPAHYSEDYFDGLTNEKAITRYVGGVPTIRYVKVAQDKANEPVDIRVYAMAALEIRNVNFKAVQAVFEKHRETETEQAETTPDPKPKTETRRKARPRRRRGGFVNKWK